MARGGGVRQSVETGGGILRETTDQKGVVQKQSQRQEQSQDQEQVKGGSTALTSTTPPEPSFGKPTVSWSTEAGEIWIAAFGGTANFGAIGNNLKPLVRELGWSRVERSWRVYCLQRQLRFASPNDFATRAFGYLDDQFEAGYPDDDVYLSEDMRDPRRPY